MTAYERNAPAPPQAHIYLPTANTSQSNPMDMGGCSNCRIYLLASGDAGEIDVIMKGAPNEAGPYLDEISEHAKLSGVKDSVSYVLRDTSRFLIVEAPKLQGSWTIWVVPI
ncbi:hypothetical protein [Paenibacillus chungangensis]|uniref:Uncharacterized protein n=1 Tax=Paenibacillus chungangensis TaxID=696535 RepID=A0ABW3HUE2_9BACL